MNALTFEVLSIQSNDAVLEIGFGGGDLKKKVLSFSNTVQAQGLELSDEMIDFVSKQQKEAIKSGLLILKKGDAGALPFRDSTFGKIRA